MSSSINFSSKAVFFLIAWLVLLSACTVTKNSTPVSGQLSNPLKLKSLSSDKPSPQTAKMTTVTWRAEASGGAGALTYEFRISDGKEEKLMQSGPSPEWQWTPVKAWLYRIKAIVRDGRGSKAESRWTDEYVIIPHLKHKPLIAVLPIENISGKKAPLKDIKKAIMDNGREQGLNFLEEGALEGFMDKHRIRYTGGIDWGKGAALREETGAEAVLITSLELYSEITPPRMAIISRLVLLQDYPVILWMDGIGLSGNKSPGLLGLGLIKDSKVLLQKVIKPLTGSLAGYLSGIKDSTGGKKMKKRFKPRISYRSTVLDTLKNYTIAVLPFYNRSARDYAGEIIMLHFLRNLAGYENIKLIEPGLIRQQLLRYRIIMDDGISLAHTDIIFDKTDADLIITGMVFDYHDYQGEWGIPEVEFSTQVIERNRRKMVWDSKSYNNGEEGVLFFDFGKRHTAHELTSEMTGTVVSGILE